MENIPAQNSPQTNPPVPMSYPDLINVDLSPKGVWMRRKKVKYQGDPDLYPIRSDENAFLVRMLYNIAQKINSTVIFRFLCTAVNYLYLFAAWVILK